MQKLQDSFKFYCAHTQISPRCICAPCQITKNGSVLALSVIAARCQLPQSGSPWQSTQTSSLCQGLSLWERWICEAKTERASLLKIKAPATKFRRFSEIQKRLLQMLSCYVVHLFLGSGNRIRRVHQLFSQCSVMLPPCCPTVVRTLFRSVPCFGRPSASSAGAVSV